MKKIKLIALAILSGLAFSCSSDDGPSTSGEFTGKWYFKETRVGGETIPYDDHEVCGKDYIQFNADGTGKSVDVYNCAEFDEIFTYTRNGNNITLTFGGEPSTVQITELSSTTLKVKSTYDYDGDGDEEQVIEVLTRT
ncbi:MAG: lipocalin family protein [Flavobacterium sp.]|uniref:lipocalin family protein n=1 Tax=Flavobacterium sp. TaxID=239 RepID=UPI0032648122